MGGEKDVKEVAKENEEESETESKEEEESETESKEETKPSFGATFGSMTGSTSFGSTFGSKSGEQKPATSTFGGFGSGGTSSFAFGGGSVSFGKKEEEVKEGEMKCPCCETKNPRDATACSACAVSFPKGEKDV